MKTIEKMYAHLHWANEHIVKAIENSDEDNQEIIRLFSHVLFAEKIWFTRLKRLDSSSLPIWSDDASLESCLELAHQNKALMVSFFDQISSQQLDTIVSYKNSGGKQYSHSLRDILTHVALHGQYHRGQINLLLRKQNKEPVAVDYITFVR